MVKSGVSLVRMELLSPGEISIDLVLQNSQPDRATESNWTPRIFTDLPLVEVTEVSVVYRGVRNRAVFPSLHCFVRPPTGMLFAIATWLMLLAKCRMDWADRWLLLATPWKSGRLFRSLRTAETT